MDENIRLLIIGVVAVLCAIFVGQHVHRETSEREPIRSGAVAQLMNLIASMAFAAVIPTALLGLILGVLHTVVPVILSLFALTFVVLMIYAVVEQPAAAKIAPTETVEELWTAEKARSSGL
jgi:threonine/homoserine/homoserine lactone efflux protein